MSLRRADGLDQAVLGESLCDEGAASFLDGLAMQRIDGDLVLAGQDLSSP